jgi:hypothetical protein
MLGILFMMILRKMVSLQRLPTQIKTKYKDIAKRPILKNQPALKLNEKNQSIHKVPLKETLGIARSRSITNAMSFMERGR